MARFRRRYDDEYYDPYDPYDPRNNRWRPRRRYYAPSPGSSCLRDACLIETGCCIGESLDGNCLVLTLLTGPHLAAVLLGTARTPTSGRPLADRLIAAVRVYQHKVSARRPACCRFSPSCSEYAAQAVAAHGPVRGVGLAVRRLVRCRPGGRRGADPVPGRR